MCPLFSTTSESALTYENNKFNADQTTPPDGEVSFEELFVHVQTYAANADYDGTVLYRMELGEPVLFLNEMYTPLEVHDDDFSSETLVTGSPVANAGGRYLLKNGATIIFNASKSYDPDGSIVFYSWDWDNDGIYDEKTNLPTIAHELTIEPGKVKTIKLLVEDNDGLTASSLALVERVGIFPWNMFLPAFIKGGQ